MTIDVCVCVCVFICLHRLKISLLYSMPSSLCPREMGRPSQIHQVQLRSPHLETVTGLASRRLVPCHGA